MASVIALTTAASYGAALAHHDSITLIDNVGIEGDRHAGKKRQVTVVCTGELAAAAAEHGVDSIDGATTRRNIVIDADALPRAHGTRFTIGEVELEVWRDCAPCSLMDDFFGDGSRAALAKRCGISATVVRGGQISVGDPVSLDARR